MTPITAKLHVSSATSASTIASHVQGRRGRPAVDSSQTPASTRSAKPAASGTTIGAFQWT
ncbi:hypothetical protein [Kineococcus xinjiangensis]|uniref:hypothetical protein n=1 Tax=Kineococcus xinjiangensis TaxID=512762 RepID=UPI000CEBF76C|nr:hypothetical protein [Kineococcus xinjiangensis]